MGGNVGQDVVVERGRVDAAEAVDEVEDWVVVRLSRCVYCDQSDNNQSEQLAVVTILMTAKVTYLATCVYTYSPLV